LAAVIVVLIRRRRWRVLSEALAAGAAAATLLLSLFPGSLTALTVVNSQFQYSEDSLHTLVIDAVRALFSVFGRSVEYEDMFRADRLLSSLLFVAVCAWRYSRISAATATLLRELSRAMLLLLFGYAA